jgi:proliferating cell nuclear antigen PCNA
MAFIAKLAKASVLKTIFEVVEHLIDETYIYIRNDGIMIYAMDSSHVAMFHALFPKECFVEYGKFDVDEIKIGTRIQDLVKILRRAKATDELSIVVDDPKNPSLSIKIVNEKMTRTFKLKHKDIQAEDIKWDNFNETLKDKFTASFSISGVMLDEFIKDAMIMSDLVDIKVNGPEKSLSFIAFNESGDVEIDIDLSRDDGGCKAIELKNDATGKYALQFLESFMKLQAVVDDFTFSIGNNIPASISCKSFSIDGDENSPAVSISYLLAPRVEEEGLDDDEGNVDGVDGDINEVETEDATAGEEPDDGHEV